MADTTVPMLLNRGIDLVTPPLLSESGTLLDSYNYEISADIGYRRWDGYERRDGYPGGGFFTWNSFTVTVVSAPFADWGIGDLIYQEVDIAQYEPVGVVAAVNPVGNRINYVPYKDNAKFFTGDTLYRWDGSSFDEFTAASTTVDGRTIVTDPDTYLTTTRSYQTLLRNLVQDAPATIAGLFYSRDRSYEVLDAVTVEADFLVGSFIEGERVRLNGAEYMYIGRRQTGGVANNYQYNLMPTGNAALPNTPDMVGIDTGTTITPGTTLLTGSEFGYLVWCGFPSRSVGVASPAPRNRVPVQLGMHYSFNNGSYATAEAYPPTGTYYITTTGGATLLMTGTVNQFDTSSGTWAGNNAAGRANIEPSSFGAGRHHLIVGDEVHTVWPTTGSSRIMTLTSNSTAVKLAGTNALRRTNTFYQWGTYNFYASVGSEALFGANGVYRAFIATASGVSNVYTQANDALDNPRYLTFHAGVQLGLGFSEGSYQISVGGVPYDFSGTRGALEIGTGDDITGLLEGANDSTIVFGKRSIRRVTGTTDTTLALETISANAGAYDYTAVNVGATPVFTGPNGVGTLQQTASYGDFVGERATSSISTWLLPRIVVSEGGIDPVGPRCAIPVRNKNQYRLFLNSGDVVTVTFTSEGPKVMKGNYKQPAQKPMIPFAWSSAVSDVGDEHIEVVWDREYARTVGEDGEFLPQANRAYRLDNGWGFDGEVFEHWFDVSYTFLNNGTEANRVSRVTAFGLGYGVASLDLKTVGIEDDFDLPWSSRTQPINMPSRTKLLYDTLQPVKGIVDHQNWGYGVKVRINGTVNFDEDGGNVFDTEPSHIIQVLVMYLEGPGAPDA